MDQHSSALWCRLSTETQDSESAQFKFGPWLWNREGQRNGPRIGGLVRTENYVQFVQMELLL